MARTKGKAEVEKKALAMERLRIEYVSIDSIHPNTYNPNRQSEYEFNLLLKSIQEDGFTQPVVVLFDSTIVDGEHRWRAAKKLGYTEIPVARMPEGVTLQQAQIATLRHNRARGSEDVELSAEVLRDLQRMGAIDWAQESLQLSDVEINRLIEDVPAPEALAADAFGQAWVPDPTAPYQDATAEAQERQDNALGATTTTASTTAAVEALREREKAIKAARTEEERQSVRDSKKFYRISLLFEGEEADLVKNTLGARPAEKLVELCRRA